MSKSDRYVLLMALMNELARRGSWCGETHVQKAAYLAQSLWRIPLDYDFLLYKHGPYSFALTDELTAMRADNVISLRSQPYPYGPTLSPSEQGKLMMLERSELIDQYLPQLVEVAKVCGGKGVAELERLATACFVTRESEADASVQERGERVSRLKPHISESEAIATLADVDRIIAEFGSGDMKQAV